MTARALLEASIDLWRALGPVGATGRARALASLGEVIRRLGDPATARALASEAVTLCREQGERWGLAYSLSMLGMALRDQDDFALARSVITESVVLWRDLGDLWGLGSLLNVSAMSPREMAITWRYKATLPSASRSHGKWVTPRDWQWRWRAWALRQLI
jgi:tetratricopeptide repeat protein